MQSSCKVSVCRLTNLCPTEHVTDWHCLAENAFTMFIQVFHDELLNVHLQQHTDTQVAR